MKLASLALLMLLVACGSKKDDAPKKDDPPKTGSAEPVKKDPPPQGSAKTDKPDGSAGSSQAKADGSGSDAGSAKADGSGAGSGSAKADDFNFSAMKTEDQIDYMKKTVVPAMKVILQKYDPKEFAEVNCKTCHGKDPKGTKYAMPSADLPKLDFAKLKEGKLSEKDMKMAKFMADVVTPEMAKLLHRPQFSEKTPDGFGCLGCHQEKK